MSLPGALATRSLEIAATLGAHPSVSLPWSMLSAQSANLQSELRVAELVSDAQQTVAYVAYCEHQISMFGLPVIMRETPGNRLAAYYNSLVAPPDAMAPLLAALAAQEHGRCDVLQFPALVSGSPSDQAIMAMSQANGWRTLRYPSFRSPYMPLNGSWQEYLDSKSQNFRYNLKRKRKALAKAGRVDERWYRDAASVPEFIQFMNAIEQSSWKTRAGMAITGSQRELAYHELLLPWLAEIGALAANVLLLDDSPIAYSLCVNWHGRIGQLKTSFDERAANLSPGLIVVASCIEDAFGSGAKEFDFLGDAMPHKMHWTDAVRAQDNLFAFLPTARGALLGRIKQLLLSLRPPAAPNTIGRTDWKE